MPFRMFVVPGDLRPWQRSEIAAKWRSFKTSLPGRSLSRLEGSWSTADERKRAGNERRGLNADPTRLQERENDSKSQIGAGAIHSVKSLSRPSPVTEVVSHVSHGRMKSVIGSWDPLRKQSRYLTRSANCLFGRGEDSCALELYGNLKMTASSLIGTSPSLNLVGCCRCEIKRRGADRVQKEKYRKKSIENSLKKK